ncbi:LysM peptidoglycan-binding domain-containing protein [Bacillus cereus]|uniref:LysM peptidoglycan-binding domain-containing protein n=1 Tax=Bacillus luti TaxID=2026191 RepID=A0A7V7S8F9_9BACI|nr:MULTISPECIES: LysM peptidoglycan-binding domain-containing protein [Bacillus cereus group]EEK79777.1 Peptidoglycan-binding protein, LysM domain [Bacillus cereus R309803]KAA0766845.1 LysM peptidoglycan-binding domain-containing protein [Bacillus sp. SH5-2]KAB2443475.1 LysM peptidoglycan-binding domain-containing protein [Bacillus luti]OJE53265.1 peptidase M23 [Bacillus luti]PFW56348.1 peptidase M23 [Bacillus cereus]
MRKRIPDFEEELEVERVEEDESLPPRSEIHRNKEKKQKFKMNHIFVRVLTFLFILLPISILWYTDKYIQVKSDSNNAGKSAFEVIFFDSAKSESPKQSEKVATHTVKEGETLESIARQYFSDESGIEVIKKYNNLQEDEVSVGQELKIPIKDKSAEQES